MFGKAAAIDATYNTLVNDTGCRNGNKPGDLKVSRVARWPGGQVVRWQILMQVEQANLEVKKRVVKLCGNVTPESLSLIGR